jgi:hypothetical protein
MARKKQDSLIEGTKYDYGKIRYSTVPNYALEEVIQAFTYGADKYEAYNYSKGMNYTRYIDAALRHINAYLRGEDIDESGNTHLSHAVASLMMLMDNIKIGSGNDDRNPNYGIKSK